MTQLTMTEVKKSRNSEIIFETWGAFCFNSVNFGKRGRGMLLAAYSTFKVFLPKCIFGNLLLNRNFILNKYVSSAEKKITLFWWNNWKLSLFTDFFFAGKYQFQLNIESMNTCTLVCLNFWPDVLSFKSCYACDNCVTW